MTFGFKKMLLTGGLLLSAIPAYADGPKWSYDGDKNDQDNWAYLSPAYTGCESGINQSPVQIGETKDEKMPALEEHYSEGNAHISTVDHAIRITVDGDQTLRDGNKTYKLQYITFHTPSEHIIKDRFYVIEAQLFHQDKAGKTLIVSVFIEQGNSPDAFRNILQKPPMQTDLNTDMRFNPAVLLPVARGYYAYSGSLTTPPCTEGVEWRIFKHSTEATLEQISAIVAHMRRNARATQPVYMRTIRESKE